MQSPVLDPFGDYEVAGYLRNRYRAKDLNVVRHLEAAAFQNRVHGVLRDLRRLKALEYGEILEVHRSVFRSVYPWAGEDRSVTAPHLAIGRGGYLNLFAHPADVRRAGEYGLSLAKDPVYLRQHPGEAFGYLAHSHPFLEGNGRTLLTVFAELCRRAAFHIEWHLIAKKDFLQALTSELLKPGAHLDNLVLRYTRAGVLSSREIASKLQHNFDRR